METIAELVGFVIILLVLYRFVWPLVTKMVTDRQDVVQQQVDDSAEAERKLADAQRRYDSAVAEAHQEAARIRDDARADATRIRDELTEQAERDVERIKARGVEQLAAHRDLIVRQLRGEVGGQSMQLAERIVVDSLADDSRRSASVDGFLDDIDRLPDRGSDNRQAAAAGGGAH